MRHYIHLLKNLLEFGDKVTTRGLTTIELLNVHLTLEPYQVLYSEPNVRSLETKILPYLRAELAWYFEGVASVSDIKKYAKMWESISNSKGEANSNYGKMVFYDRIHWFNSSYFDWCKIQLETDINSRKAIILYNRPEYFYDTKDFICTQTQQFFIRDNKLSSTVYIRSSDAIRGLTFDIPWWSIVQQYLMLKLRAQYPSLELGQLTIFIGSSHIYAEHKNLTRIMSKSKDMSFYNLELKTVPELNKSFVHYYETIMDHISITPTI